MKIKMQHKTIKDTALNNDTFINLQSHDLIITGRWITSRKSERRSEQLLLESGRSGIQKIKN